MKRLFFEKAYQPFVLTGLIALCIAIFFKGAYPDSVFDLSVYNKDYSIFTSRIWFLFVGYLFFLALIYFIISKTKLKTKRWLVISHYIFIVLFLVFFIIFSSFSNPGVQEMLAGIPLITLISVYGIIFLFDGVFFILGLLFLFINLFSLKKNNIK